MILIVDDENAVLTVTAKILTHAGYTVITACNGLEGVERFRELAAEIDLVILDKSMPVLDGNEAFRQIRALRPDAVIAMSTGWSDDADTAPLDDVQPNGVISKPYEMGPLIESVRALLGGGTAAGVPESPAKPTGRDGDRAHTVRSDPARSQAMHDITSPASPASTAAHVDDAELPLDLTRPVLVLLVEDNVGFAYYVRDVLTRQKPGRFEVHETRSLQHAVELLSRSRFDVVLLDLGLPDSARIKTFDAVHAAAPDTPIIVLTVLDDDALALQAVRAGAQDYLIKDEANRSLLIRSIRYAIERDRSRRSLRALSARLLHLQDEERRRIARDLHDVSGQHIAALSMALSLLSRDIEKSAPQHIARVQECQAILGACSADLRTLSYLLHPPLLDELGLAGVVRDYADGFAARSGIRVDLELPQDLVRLARDVETALFRIMQECLFNIHRHSGSATASIRFAIADGEILLEVRDTGHGFDTAARAAREDSAPSLGVGLAGMRERVAQLGGRLRIESGREGTHITATLPFVTAPT